MPKFGTVWLFALILVVASLLSFAQYDSQGVYVLSCITLPCFFAVASRFAAHANHAIAVATAIISSILIGSALMAFGSYYYTFIEPSVGYFVGGGWTSVIAASMFGAFLGAFYGIIAIVGYVCIAFIFSRPKGLRA